VSIARQFSAAKPAKPAKGAKAKAVDALGKAGARVTSRVTARVTERARKKATKPARNVTRADMTDESAPAPSAALLRSRLVAPRTAKGDPVPPATTTTKDQSAVFAEALDAHEAEIQSLKGMLNAALARIVDLERAMDALPLFSMRTVDVPVVEAKPVSKRSEYMREYRRKRKQGA